MRRRACARGCARGLPHLFHAGADIERGALGVVPQIIGGAVVRPVESHGIELLQDLLGHEAAAPAIDVRITLPGLVRQVKLQRRHQDEVVLCAGEGDVEEAPLFFLALGFAQAAGRGEAPVGGPCLERERQLAAPVRVLVDGAGRDHAA